MKILRILVDQVFLKQDYKTDKTGVLYFYSESNINSGLLLNFWSSEFIQTFEVSDSSLSKQRLCKF